MPKGFIMIRKKVGDDEKVLLADLIHSSPHHHMFARTSANERDKFLSFVLSRFRVLLVTDDEEILSQS